MRTGRLPSRFEWLGIAAVSCGLFSLLEGAPGLLRAGEGLSVSADAWRTAFGSASPLVILFMCCVLAIALWFAQHTSHVSDLPGAIVVGMLFSVLAIAAVVGASVSLHAVGYGLGRALVLCVGIITASVAEYLFGRPVTSR
jgi:hypothetical protein